MRAGRNMMVALSAVALMVGPLVMAAHAQEGSAAGSEQRPAQGMAGDQPTGQMGSLDQMMERMQSVMGTMSGMMGGPGMGMGSGMMGAQGAPMGPEMTGMMQTVDGLGQSMNEVMLQMREVMRNDQLMAQPGVPQQMQKMQENMGTMLDGYQNMVHNLRQLRGDTTEPPRQ